LNPNISNNNCPTCCANRREDRRIVDEGDDGDTYCDDPWHGNAPPTPAPADDATTTPPQGAVCLDCGGPAWRTHYPAGWSAPYCAHKRWRVPTAVDASGAVAKGLPHVDVVHEPGACAACDRVIHPADDARGAEAWAYAIVDRDGKYAGIVSQDRAFLASIVKADNADDLAGAPFRVVPLAPAPRERDPVREAVVEAAPFAGYEAERARFDAWWADKSDGYKRASGKGADLSGVAWDAYYERALRGAKGGA